MKRTLVAVSLAALLVPAAQARSRNMSINTTDDGPVTSCSQIDVSFDHVRAARAEEQLPVSGARSIKVTASNGGVYVHGGSGYAVTVCKAAENEALLSGIRASYDGSEARAEGPDGGEWVAFFLVSVPSNGSLDVDTTNGPVSVRDVNGNVTARAVNGPLSVRDSSGTLDLETHNGPISLKGGSGSVKLSAQNGPISVKLDDMSWNGNLDARTSNGPLTVKVPRGFLSGTLIEAQGHGPMSCHGDVCREARRSAWDDDDEPRRIEFGTGPTVVHLSTVNGPVSVKEDE